MPQFLICASFWNGKNAEAVDSAEKTIKNLKKQLGRDVRKSSEYAQLLHNLGVVHHYGGEFRNARKCFIRAGKIYKKLGDTNQENAVNKLILKTKKKVNVISKRSQLRDTETFR